MKTRLTVTVDSDVISDARRHACDLGMSLSSLIEASLREAMRDEEPAFTQQWRGQFRAAPGDDPRHEALVRKYN